MPERDLIERLDDAVEAMLRRPEAARVPEEAELAGMWRVAADLVDLPRSSFRARLESEIQRRAAMSTSTAVSPAAAEAASARVTWRPEGFRSLTPYLIVRDGGAAIAFMKEAFGAVEQGRVKGPDGRIMHAEIRIGDSMLELGEGGEAYPARPAALHLYVDDADTVYARAVAAGATTLFPLGDRPYGDREADVKDPFGNNWYIGTHQQGGPIPEGMNTLTLTLHAKGTDRLIGFVKDAFGAQEIDVTRAPDGVVVHAQLKLDDSMLELGEARGVIEPMPCGIHYYVPDVDAAYARAVAAGGKSVAPPSLRPYGERAAQVEDPAGNQWFLATLVKDVRA
jgi:PhnB protein